MQPMFTEPNVIDIFDRADMTDGSNWARVNLRKLEVGTYNGDVLRHLRRIQGRN